MAQAVKSFLMKDDEAFIQHINQIPCLLWPLSLTWINFNLGVGNLYIPYNVWD